MMKRFVETIRHIFAIEELRTRILNTIGFLIIFRIGSFVVLPGVNPDALTADTTGIFGLLNTFLGGAFSRASVFALGIMPYISASIVLQLMTVAVPYFQKLQKEGDSGRKKINQLTRVLTIAICMAQSVGYLSAYVPSEAINTGLSPFMFNLSSMVILTAGTIFCMWLGERITDKGIGNGISMLIMIGTGHRSDGPGCAAGPCILCKAGGGQQGIWWSTPVHPAKSERFRRNAYHFRAVPDVLAGDAGGYLERFK
jgi:preprotein translocase subunit SecY